MQNSKSFYGTDMSFVETTEPLSSNIKTETVHWFRIIALFIFGIIFNIYASITISSFIAIVSTLLVMLVGLFVLRSWELFILAFMLGTFDHLVMWINPGMSVFNEPLLFKLIKDVLIVTLALSCFKIHSDLRPPFFWTFLIFSFYFFIRGLLQPGAPEYAATYIRYYIVYPLVGMLFSRSYDSIYKIQTAFRFLCFIALIASLIGFYEISTGRVTYYSGYVSFGFIDQRMVSTLGNPNNLGLFMLLPLFYLISGLFIEKHRHTGSVIIGLVLAAAIFLSFSRTSFVMLILGSLIISFQAKSIRRFLLICTLLIISGFVMTYIYLGRGEGDTFGSRPEMFVFFLKQSIEDPVIFLIGNGLGSGVIDTGLTGDIRTVVTDNAYTDIIRTSGVVGLFLFLLFLLQLTMTLIHYGRTHLETEVRRIYSALLAWHFTFILFGMAGVVFRLYPAALIYWVSIIWIVNIAHIERDDNWEYTYFGAD